MRVLLDEQLPIELSSELRGHTVETVVGRGGAGIKNGELLRRMRGHYKLARPSLILSRARRLSGGRKRCSVVLRGPVPRIHVFV